MRELPILDLSRCRSHGDCVEVCPTRCLEMDGGAPWMPRPRDCIACAACVLVCPEEALTMAPWQPA
jgi:NAD-dependent dihydropyrimidine dehydrogenase PreA subunit